MEKYGLTKSNTFFFSFPGGLITRIMFSFINTISPLPHLIRQTHYTPTQAAVPPNVPSDMTSSFHPSTLCRPRPRHETKGCALKWTENVQEIHANPILRQPVYHLPQQPRHKDCTGAACIGAQQRYPKVSYSKRCEFN